MASDLIRRKAMLERLEKWNTSDCLDKAFYEFTKSRIIEQPTVDAAPVVHGEWVDKQGNRLGLNEKGRSIDESYCSVCGRYLSASDEYAVLGLFCPNCGAKMDGGKE